MTQRPAALRSSRTGGPPRRQWWTACALAVVACSRGPRPAGESTVGVGSGRRFVEARFDTLWTFGGPSFGGFQTPEYLAADSGTVYVGDSGSQSIHALDARSGRLLWRTAGGSDTSAVSAPRTLTARRSGGVIAFDADRRLFVSFGPTGRVERRTPVPSIELAQAVCELPDSSLLVAVMGSSKGVVRFSLTGEPRGVHALPWRDLDTASSLVAASLLAPTPAGCVSALALGRGFAFFDGARFSASLDYVEPTPLPAVLVERRVQDGATVVSSSLAEHVMAAQDVAANASGVLIAFGGHTVDRAHILDAYDATGAYRASYRTGRRVEAIAASDSALFILAHRDGAPIVVALRWPPRAR